MQYTIGNTTGKYFTEWRFDILRQVAEAISVLVQVESFHLFYVPEPVDYHCLQFEAGGHNFLIRFYKVLSCIIDGDEKSVWRIGRNYTIEMARHVRNELSAKSHEPT
jgi:hypothetical protein